MGGTTEVGGERRYLRMLIPVGSVFVLERQVAGGNPRFVTVGHRKTLQLCISEQSAMSALFATLCQSLGGASMRIVGEFRSVCAS